MYDADEDATEESIAAGRDAETLAVPVTADYKVLGQLTDADGVGVLGQNDAATGTPVGVEGAVPNADGYGLKTVDDARIEGDLWTTGDHTVRVDGNRALILGPEIGGDAGNVVAGHSSNEVTNGAAGATIGGGGFDDGVDDDSNEVADDYGTVGGGRTNRVTARYATVAGGLDNRANAARSSVLGGVFNRADGYGSTVGGGSANQSDGDYATIAGGGPVDPRAPDTTRNEVTDDYGTIGGGGNNLAGDAQSGTTNATYATVGGGKKNEATGPKATVGGGAINSATATGATVGGGAWNESKALFATVAGGGPSDTGNASGTNNRVTDDYGTIGGGGNNRAGDAQSGTTNATYATVGGGWKNTATAEGATVAGGENNDATAENATVGGGNNNDASKDDATVAGGSGNDASDGGATVGGGKFNEATAGVATVPGGINNSAGGVGAFAAGSSANAADDRAFVWNDGSGETDSNGSHTDQFSSATSVGSTPTGPNTFSVKATQGVRFVTSADNSTYAWMDTSGNVKASGTKDFVETVQTGEGERTVTYAAVEAPTVRTEVSGVATVEDGYAEVDLPGNFAWVTDAEQPLVAQVTAHDADGAPRVTERSTHRLVIEDAGDPPDAYEVSYTVKGTREGYADRQAVADP